MIRAALLPLALLAGPAPASDLGTLTPDERAVLGQAIRDTLLAYPDLVAGAVRRLAPPRIDIYEDDREQDLDALDRARDTLFAVTPEGFGAADPEKVVALFVTYPCGDCAMAEKGLRALAQQLPHLRVEIRAAENTPAARILRARADELTPDALAALRQDYYESPPAEETDEEARNLETLASVQEDATTFHELGLDVVPSYVLPEMMLRGEMPGIVLHRYLNGQ